MIEARTDARLIARIQWTADARRTVAELMRFIRASSMGRPAARRQEIELAVQRLRYTPLFGEVTAVRNNQVFRCLVVGGRFNVYYVYRPPKTSSSLGIISIRAVKHAARERPFLGVRDSPQLPA